MAWQRQCRSISRSRSFSNLSWAARIARTSSATMQPPLEGAVLPDLNRSPRESRVRPDAAYYCGGPGQERPAYSGGAEYCSIFRIVLRDRPNSRAACRTAGAGDSPTLPLPRLSNSSRPLCSPRRIRWLHPLTGQSRSFEASAAHGETICHSVSQSAFTDRQPVSPAASNAGLMHPHPDDY